MMMQQTIDRWNTVSQITLNEWENKYGRRVANWPTNHAHKVIYMRDGEIGRRELWGLSDYKVSGLNGPAIWLVPIGS